VDRTSSVALMKTIATTLVLLLAWTACSTAQPDPAPLVALGQPFTLAVGAAAQLGNSDLRVGFTGVSSDSRCPKGVQCVWAGDAVAQVWLQRGAGTRQALALHTAAGAGQSAQAGAHVLGLLQLQPAPVEGRAMMPANYHITLVLTAAPQLPER